MISLRTFNLEKIDEREHYVLIKNLSREEGVRNYVSANFSNWIKKQISESDDKIEVGKAYVIVKDNHYVGIIGSLNFSHDGILELWYAIEKNLQGRGYGEKILAEITPYLIEKLDGLNDIKLKIAKSNRASQKVAERNGYIKRENLIHENTDDWYYFNRDSQTKMKR